MSGLPANDRARDVWARARVHVWPERYRLVSLPPERLADAAALAGRAAGGFAGLVLERDEVSLAVPEDLWRESPLRGHARNEAGPYRAITLDIDVDLDVTGYLAPAATLLAEAGVSIVPICAFLKDHLLVQERDLQRALAVLHDLIARSRGNRGE
jgi:hypothetical protein